MTAHHAAGPQPRGSGSPVLELTGAGCRFGSAVALRPVTLSVDAGTTCLVHGANGSGKTTLLRVCAGLLTPTSGTRAASGRCLYLRPGSAARRRQTVREALRAAAALAGGGGPGTDEAIECARLGAFADRRVETLSSGQRSRLVVGVAVVVAPALACLDEPTAHLDEAGGAVLRAGVARLAATGTAVLVATHDRALLEQPDARLSMHDGLVEDAGCSGVR